MHSKISTRIALTLAISAFAGSGIALGGDTTSERETALERLEAARIAFEAAKAELEQAQAAAAAVVSGETIAEGEGQRRAQPAEEGEEAAEEVGEPDSWLDGWVYKAFLGFNGASGNNENFSARASIDGERFTEKYETKLALSYIYATADGEKESSRGEASIRNDWLIEDSKWRYFANGKYEYDEFQEWRHRLSASVGVGYELIDTEDTTLLIGRAGIGGYYEMGNDADEEFVPEGLLGLELRHRISENSTLEASTTYYPNLEDFGEFRWVNTAGLEVVMDADTGLTLNTGFEHRHDSQPGDGFEHNDVEYYMGLGWTF